MFVFKIYLIGTIGDSRAAKTEVLQDLAFLKNSKNFQLLSNYFQSTKFYLKLYH